MTGNIIGMHTFSVSTEMATFARGGAFRAVPMILYKVNYYTLNHVL